MDGGMVGKGFHCIVTIHSSFQFSSPFVGYITKSRLVADYIFYRN